MELKEIEIEVKANETIESLVSVLFVCFVFVFF